MEELLKVNYYEEEEEMIIRPPYYRVLYKDDEGRTHLATVKDLNYFDYLKDRFFIIEYKFIEA